MSNPGFVYILVNPSLAGLLKIGKTDRTPEERARELSMATGVPTPFMVVFHEQFDDCDVAERYVHALLQQQGYRVADNREFFGLPVRDAVMAIIEAKNTLSAGNIQPPISTDDLRHTAERESEPWRDVFEEAEVYRYGLGEELADPKRALRLYKQAATLGSSFAYLRLGEMHEQGAGGEPNSDKALDCLREAARLGEGTAYAPMARLYYSLEQYANAEKCWKRYFSYIVESEGDEDIDTAETALGAYVRQAGSGLIQNNCADEIKRILGPDSQAILNRIAELQLTSQVTTDALNALSDLGYERARAEKVVREAIDETRSKNDLTVELILRNSLRALADV